MISRRNYFASVMLIVVLMFLLMASTVLRDRWNDYNANAHLSVPGSDLSGVNIAWENEAGTSDTGSCVLIGSSENDLGLTVLEWTEYSRRDFSEYPSLAAYDHRPDTKRPEMIAIDSDYINWQTGEDTQRLANYASQGINLVFLTLPDVSVVRSSAPLKNLLGISAVAGENLEADGIFLYSGFLLGGEKVYLPPDNPAPEAVEQFVFPGNTSESGKPVFDYYLLGAGTKLYMRGIPDGDNIEEGDYPALIWRRSQGSSYVFAVNGGYMEGAAGLGILTAISSDMHPYEIYPVVNAQSMILVNYPVLSNENAEEIKRLYSRSIQDVHQEIIWPDIWRTIQPYDYKVTCMVSPQLDYDDDTPPQADRWEYYLKIFNEDEAEAGLSLENPFGTPASVQAEEDEKFFADNSDYIFFSAYAGNTGNSEIKQALNNKLLSNVDTIVKAYGDESGRIIGAFDSEITAQTAFNADFNFTYKQDFETRCVMTAIGYSNVYYDMTSLVYPEGEEDTWEWVYPEFHTSVDGFGALFPDFDKTTAAESGERVRSFLTSRYTDSRTGDVITLKAQGAGDPKWFVLRTHYENVVGAQGADYTQIEEGAYLIGAYEDEVKITLEPAANTAQK